MKNHETIEETITIIIDDTDRSHRNCRNCCTESVADKRFRNGSLIDDEIWGVLTELFGESGKMKPRGGRTRDDSWAEQCPMCKMRSSRNDVQGCHAFTSIEVGGEEDPDEIISIRVIESDPAEPHGRTARHVEKTHGSHELRCITTDDKGSGLMDELSEALERVLDLTNEIGKIENVSVIRDDESSSECRSSEDTANDEEEKLRALLDRITNEESEEERTKLIKQVIEMLHDLRK